MPWTLSLITNVFPPEERGRAISYWAAIAGVGVALGPISGGLLIEHFYWGSIFLVNLPIVAVALGPAARTCCRSPKTPRTPSSTSSARPCRSSGCSRSSTGSSKDRPKGGRARPDPRRVRDRCDPPRRIRVVGAELDPSHAQLAVLREPRFSAASLGIMLIFFAMFGSTFLLTQYLQSVMGFSALRARRRAVAVGGDHAGGRADERAVDRARRDQAGGRHRVELRDRVALVHQHAARRPTSATCATCCRASC